MKRRYNFDRYRYGALMAQGIAVHAENMSDAEKMADDILRYGIDVGNAKTDVLLFTDHDPCPTATRCEICELMSPNAELSGGGGTPSA